MGRRQVYCERRQVTSIRVSKPPLAFASVATLNTTQGLSGLKRNTLISFIIVLLFCLVDGFGQEFLPSPPADKALIYTLDDRNNLVALPFEAAGTPLNTKAAAKSNKTSYIELKGAHAATTLGPTPRLFLFTTQRQGTHPPFLVWLTPKSGNRRATAIAQAGMAGYAISSDEIVKPSIRVLAQVGDEVFLEIRPRTSLVPGEYAIIGEDLTRVATFRVLADAMR